MRVPLSMPAVAAALFCWSAPSAAEVTFERIAPILEQRCLPCHNAGEAAPMPLATYRQARPWARAIREAVLMGRMPPWLAEPGTGGPFRNDRSLSAEEKRLLAAWADDGAPEGRPLPAPAVPKPPAASWRIGPPDRSWELPPFALPSTGELEYTYYLLPGAFPEDVWVESAELRPVARGAVHHLVAYLRPPGSSYLEGYPAREYFVPRRDTRDRILGPESPFAWRELLAVYTPGTEPLEPEPGTARFVPAGSDLIIELHYTPDARSREDRVSLGIRLAREPPSRRRLTVMAANGAFAIPPGDPAHRVDARIALAADVELLALMPHMHLRGKSFEYRLIYPSGLEETLLRVPRWNFNWQINYRFAEPVRVPRGSRIEATAWFDNSANNPWNPDPSATVRWGDQTSEEMMVGFIELAFPASLPPEKLFFGRLRPPRQERPE